MMYEHIQISAANELHSLSMHIHKVAFIDI